MTTPTVDDAFLNSRDRSRHLSHVTYSVAVTALTRPDRYKTDTNYEASVTHTERRASGILRQSIINLNPWSFRAYAIVHLRFHGRIAVQCA
jgi:hypothetical protein